MTTKQQNTNNPQDDLELLPSKSIETEVQKTPEELRTEQDIVNLERFAGLLGVGAFTGISWGAILTAVDAVTPYDLETLSTNTMASGTALLAGSAMVMLVREIKYPAQD